MSGTHDAQALSSGEPLAKKKKPESSENEDDETKKERHAASLSKPMIRTQIDKSRQQAAQLALTDVNLGSLDEKIAKFDEINKLVTKPKNEASPEVASFLDNRFKLRWHEWPAGYEETLIALNKPPSNTKIFVSRVESPKKQSIN